MVDVLVAELAESVSSGLVLDDSTEIQRVAIVTHRAIGDGLSAVVHIAYSSIVCRVRNNDDQRLVEVPFIDSRSLAGVFEYFVVVAFSVASAKGDTTFR